MANWDYTLKLWKISSRRMLKEFKGHSSSVNCIMLSKDGKFFVSGGEDNTIRIWRVSDGIMIRMISLSPDFNIQEADFSGAKGLEEHQLEELKGFGAVIE